MRKLHLGCGTVYLTPSVATDPVDGWLNVDLPGPRMMLAKDSPELVERLSTTPDKYYLRHVENVNTMRPGPHGRVGVCDRYGDARRIQEPDDSFDAVVARHVIEHLSVNELRMLLSECERVLTEDGILRLTVPDPDGTITELIRTKCDPFYARHLFGTRQDDVGYHLVGYTREGLRKIVEEHGLEFVREEPNINFYPAFTLVWKKPRYRRPAWDYALSHYKVEFPTWWNVLDVGCGSNPWPRANVVLDCYRENGQYKLDHQDFYEANLCDPLPFQDKEFDYVSAFHVLEHLVDPISAAMELSRVAKAGIVVCPAPWKEALSAWQEKDHIWHVLPPLKRGSPLEFRRIDPEWRKRIADDEVRNALFRVFRKDPDVQGRDTALLRRWFTRTEYALDVVYQWESVLCLETRG